MHTAHKIGNTSGVSKSSSDWLNYRVFTGDVCVTFFNVLPGNKDAVTPNPLTKKKALVFTTVTISAYQDQLNTGFSKICKVCPWALHTGLLLWGNFHAPKHDTAQNKTWLVALPVSHMASSLGRGLAKVPKPSAISLKVWLHKTNQTLIRIFHKHYFRNILS